MIPHVYVQGENLVEAYHKSILGLNYHGAVVQCPDWNTECVEIFLNAEIMHPLQEPVISGLSICDPYSLEKYRMEMLDGLIDWAVPALEPYTYHQRIGAQEDAAIHDLLRSKDSRRAAITIRYPNDGEMDDAPCLQHIQYMIRDEKLDAFVLFRSNDAVKAAYMNMFAIAMMQARVAEKLGVECGSLTYTANSYHCYQRDWPTLRGYVRAIEGGSPPTYNYAGDWQEMMDGERERILEDVRQQRIRSEGL